MEDLIFLSPSDQTENKYASGNTNEAVECREIANYCEAALKRSGLGAINEQTGNMYERVEKSNAKKVRYHVAIHTNAHNKKVSGTRIFTWDLEGEGYEAAKAIFAVLSPLTPGESENIKADPSLYEIKYTDAPCIYIEVDFHDVASVAKWIDEHNKEIGEAIAEGICNICGVKFKKAKEETKPKEKADPKEEAEKVIKEDGLWGTETTNYTQIVLGTPKDGIVSNQLNKCKDFLPNMLATSWEFENIANGGSAMIEALQELLADAGYYTGKIDGYAGELTVIALQKFLADLGLYTGKIDGVAGKLTVTAWQKYINLKSI